MDTELDKYRTKLIKSIGQGEQINNLTAAPEWEFFEGWLTASKDKLQRQMNSTAFINDHNGYLDARAGVAAIDMILDGIQGFKNAYKRSVKALNEVEQSI